MSAQSIAKYSAFSTVSTILATGSALLPLPLWAGAPILALFLVSNGKSWGKCFMPRETWGWQAFFGTLCVTAFLAAAGAAIYFVYALTPPVVAGMTVLVGGITPLLGRLQVSAKDVFQAESDNDGERPSMGDIAHSTVMGATSIALTALAASIAIGAATSESIRSPWSAVPTSFFVIFFLATLAAVLSSWRARRSAGAVLPLALISMLSVSVAALTYEVGFGFDPFIHQATESAILSEGVIEPKPLYYLGHYALVIIAARVGSLPIAMADAALVPLFVALVTPAAYWSLRKGTGMSRSAAAVAAGTISLTLPLAPFIPSTPQGLAHALFLISAFLALPALTRNAFPKRLLLLFAAAASAVHPLAGIPLIILVAFVFIASYFEEKRGLADIGRFVLMLKLFLVGSIALPAVFVAHSTLTGAGAVLNIEALASPSTIIAAISGADASPRIYVAALDVAYGWQFARIPLLIAVAALGIAYGRRHARGVSVYAAAAAAYFVNFALLKSVIDFPFLISYERANYANRIADIAIFTLAVPAALALGLAFQRAFEARASTRIALPVLIAVAAASSAYLAYPRLDQYESSRGWSTGAADIETVRSINQDAGGKEYVVLANQSTSAAAIKTLGFRTYYKSNDPERPEPVFFYPVPTGGALYETFLDANESGGTYASILEAMNLAGVDTAYFAVSRYWWKANRITQTARKVADDSWVIGDGEVYVFKYVRK